MSAAAADPTQERERLLSAFRSGRGATDSLVADTSAFLKRTWPANLSLFDVAQDQLLAELLRSFPVFPVWLEQAMTRRRLALLFSEPREQFAPLAASLALQCHLNEYAWNEDPPETERVESLAANLANLTPHEVMVLASYRPLSTLAGADDLLDRGWDGPVSQVLYEQVLAVRAERNLAATLPSLTPVRRETSLEVQAQYESNPYPRWRRPGIGAMQTHFMGRQFPANPSMLIAGCGTGKQAVQATLMIPGAKTLAVDLSRASLAYAVRKTRELGLHERISYAQADLLDLEGEARFDIVQSAGVLHHLADPFEGARRVCRMVKPGGLIALGLYSKRARAVLEPARAFAKGFAPDSVRALRQAVINLPEDDPARRTIVISPDFYSTSGCRDLLMHVQEHQLTIADLRRILDENGLTFLGFLQFTYKSLRDAYTARFPHDPNGRDLDAWEAFEAEHPRTFSRMYQFWAERRG